MKKECEQTLISDHKDSILGEFDNYLQEVKQEDLGRTFRLISCLGDAGIKLLLEAFHAFVVTFGNNQVKAIPTKDQTVFLFLGNFLTELCRIQKLTLNVCYRFIHILHLLSKMPLVETALL